MCSPPPPARICIFRAGCMHGPYSGCPCACSPQVEAEAEAGAQADDEHDLFAPPPTPMMAGRALLTNPASEMRVGMRGLALGL